MKKTIVISINTSWNVINFRSGLIAALQQEGYHVVVLTPEDTYSARLADLGVEHRSIRIDNDGTSPIRDLALLLDYWRHLRRLRPTALLSYTAKPNIYGSLAARALGIPVFNNVSGLGTPFLRRSLIKTVVSTLYRVALVRSRVVFFQNDDDRTLFTEMGLVRYEQTQVVPGSGIDVDHFRPQSSERSDGDFIFLLTARLLRDKGIAEFVEAARRIRRAHSCVRFQLLGFLDVANPTAIAREQVEAWEAEGAIEYLGSTSDVRPYLAAADCVVLPSYREGLPRSLVEAAAMSKPLIATDVPGCRAVVRDGVNGLLCAPRDADSLGDAMSRMLEADPGERAAMAVNGREIALREYDEKIVINSYVQALRGIGKPVTRAVGAKQPLRI